LSTLSMLMTALCFNDCWKWINIGIRSCVKRRVSNNLMAPPFRTILTLYVLTLSLGLVSYSLIPTSTCTSTIKTTEQYFSVNEPIPISYSIKDVSKDTITIWHCGFWCNNKIVVTDDNNIELPRTDWSKTTLSAFSPRGWQK
jgi:hypothetical protein